ncbi:hypothetical protein ACFLSS_01450 [Bacteroidota bacterium]
MRKVSICFLLAVILALSGVLYAQDTESHVFTVMTFELLNPEGGSSAEFDSLATLWDKNLTKKNEFIVSEKAMTHLWGSNSDDFVLITEYKNFADIENASNRNSELMKEAWPDKAERQNFVKAYSKYFGSHSDEIYQEYISEGK